MHDDSNDITYMYLQDVIIVLKYFCSFDAHISLEIAYMWIIWVLYDSCVT